MQVVSSPTQKRVVACISYLNDISICVACVNRVVAFPTIDSFHFGRGLVDFEITFALDNNAVVTFATTYNGVFAIGIDDVVSFATTKFIGAGTTCDVVVAHAAIDYVVSAIAAQNVIAFTALNLVIAFAASNIVVA